MTGADLKRRLVALSLIAPLLAFLAIFFVWPLIAMSSQAIPVSVVAQTLPRTADALAQWDTTSPPSDAMRTALVGDLRSVTDDEKLASLVQTLNSSKSGYRTLMAKTVSAARANDQAVDLVTVDKRWADPTFWAPIATAAKSSHADAYLLAAVDLKRDEAGSIGNVPAGSSANRDILIRTFVISAVVTITCIAIGLPYAMLMAAMTGWKRQLLLVAVLLPLWTSILVRTAAWFILLQDKGLVNGLLQASGLTSGPVPLIFNRLGVVIAMTHVLLPFMVLPIYSVLLAIPRNLMQAAGSMGAHPIRAFLEVLLPLASRGVVAGSLLVFMASIGYYITPALIGGPQDQMISSVIAFYALQTANWGMASALGLVLLSVTVVLYAVYNRLSVDQTVKG